MRHATADCRRRAACATAASTDSAQACSVRAVRCRCGAVQLRQNELANELRLTCEAFKCATASARTRVHRRARARCFQCVRAAVRRAACCIGVRYVLLRVARCTLRAVAGCVAFHRIVQRCTCRMLRSVRRPRLLLLVEHVSEEAHMQQILQASPTIPIVRESACVRAHARACVSAHVHVRVRALWLLPVTRAQAPLSVCCSIAHCARTNRMAPPYRCIA
jgi:hypothetical protein